MPSHGSRSGESLQVRNVREVPATRRMVPPGPRPSEHPPAGRYAAAAAALQPSVNGVQYDGSAYRHSPSVAPASMDARPSDHKAGGKGWQTVPIAAVIGILAGIGASIATIEIYSARGPIPASAGEPPRAIAAAIQTKAPAPVAATVVDLDEVPKPESIENQPTPQLQPKPSKSARAAKATPPVSRLTETSVSDSEAEHTRDVEAPFNREAAKATLDRAKANASTCGDGSGPIQAPVAVTFAPSGRATLAIIEGNSELRGSRVGSCVAQRMRQAQVPPFSGSLVTVHSTVVVK